MKNLEADVVIVAAGMSGLCASVAAAEKGASVIVFEKGGTSGGAANMGMGFFAVESHIQKKQLCSLTVDDAFSRFMEFNHWRSDAALVRKYFETSADTVKWIEDMGVEFLGAFKYFGGSEQTWHLPKVPGSNKPTMRSASMITKALFDRAEELGVQFQFNTSVKKINYNGVRVTGVQAVDADGEEYLAECDAVIVCTGGFGDNPKMIKEYLGYEHGSDLFSFRIPGMTGDGMKMVWEVGGAKTPAMIEMIYECPGIAGLHAVDTVMRQPNLMVNLEGRRFLNEEVLDIMPYAGNAISRQKDRVGISILSDEIVDHYRNRGIDFNSYHKSFSDMAEWDENLAQLMKGSEKTVSDSKPKKNLMGLKADERFFFTANSIEELAGELGVDPKTLAGTVQRYNEFCACGRDAEFGKNARHLLPVQGKKFYALKFYPSGYGSLGGIKVDDNLQVIRDDFSRIPGLFSAGTDCCTIFGDTYMFYFPGLTMGFAINSGRLAGYNAVKFIDTYEFED